MNYDISVFEDVSYTEKFLSSYWKRVDQKSDIECWPWRGYKNAGGYGQTPLRNHTHKAHRVAWEIFHGKKIPSNLMACHSCDNPGCVNPNHIFIGTHTDNMRDCISKGRFPVGEKHGWNTQGDSYRKQVLERLASYEKVRGERQGSAKTNQRDVIQMRHLYNDGKATIPDLSKQFGLAKPTIYNIVHRITWKHVSDKLMEAMV